MSLRPGARIGNNVCLVRPLHEGGMGSVWVADHLTLKTQVAVKFISAERAKEPGAARRFTREATAAAAIKSPHVVQTFDHGVSADGAPFIVMELLEGEDLGKRLKRRGRLEAPETARIVSQACKGLAKAHALGIVHRDIKPENIFVVEGDDEPFIKLLDFGIAKHASGDANMTTTGAVVGTPYYMSPEQVMTAQVDARSDLWSLGVVAYHCLTGARPFRGETLGGVMVAIARGTVRPPSEIVPELAPAIDAWMMRALASDPAQRFGSAKEMADALVVFDGSGARVSAPTASRIQPSPEATSIDSSTVRAMLTPLGASDAPVGAAEQRTAAEDPRTGAARRSAGGRRSIALLAAGVFLVGGLAVWSRARSPGAAAFAAPSQQPSASGDRAPDPATATATAAAAALEPSESAPNGRPPAASATAAEPRSPRRASYPSSSAGRSRSASAPPTDDIDHGF